MRKVDSMLRKLIKKIKPKKKSKLYKATRRLDFYMVGSIFILLLAMYMFGVGYHNYDMGYNMKWFDCEFGLDLVDTTLQGDKVDGNEAYQMGNIQTRVSMALFIIGGIMFGISYTEMKGLIKK